MLHQNPNINISEQELNVRFITAQRAWKNTNILAEKVSPVKPCCNRPVERGYVHYFQMPVKLSVMLFAAIYYVTFICIIISFGVNYIIMPTARNDVKLI